MAEKVVATRNSTGDEYFATFQRSEYLEPEKILLLALLEDAIHCYRKLAHVRNPAARRQFREAEEWLMGDGGKGGVFSFENICDVLGIDPEYVRRRLREAAQRLPAKSRPRHYARHRQVA